MSWLPLLNGLIGLVRSLVGWLHSKGLLDAGAQAEIAKQLAAIMAMTEEGKRLLHKVEEMSDEELDDWLKELGRG